MKLKKKKNYKNLKINCFWRHLECYEVCTYDVTVVDKKAFQGLGLSLGFHETPNTSPTMDRTLDIIVTIQVLLYHFGLISNLFGLLFFLLFDQVLFGLQFLLHHLKQNKKLKIKWNSPKFTNEKNHYLYQRSAEFLYFRAYSNSPK